jgi:hypothetical protein
MWIIKWGCHRKIKKNIPGKRNVIPMGMRSSLRQRDTRQKHIMGQWGDHHCRGKIHMSHDVCLPPAPAIFLCLARCFKRKISLIWSISSLRYFCGIHQQVDHWEESSEHLSWPNSNLPVSQSLLTTMWRMSQQVYRTYSDMEKQKEIYL